MKSFNIKMEKANAILGYRRLQKITTLFRFMEMLAFLVMISRFSSQLRLAVNFSGDYFRGITFTVFSPKLVFVIGNVIILILFLKSRVVDNGDGNGKVDLYDEYVKSCERSVVNSTAMTCTTAVTVPSNGKQICRSLSENTIRAKCKNNQTHRELRQSVTERSRSKNFDHGGGEAAVMEESYAEDELSSEDFRRTVEAFIARQQKILRDEEFSHVVYVGSGSGSWNCNL